jgi:hypothetical protein
VEKISITHYKGSTLYLKDQVTWNSMIVVENDNNNNNNNNNNNLAFCPKQVGVG